MLLKIVLYNGFKILLSIIMFNSIFINKFSLKGITAVFFEYKGGVLNG